MEATDRRCTPQEEYEGMVCMECERAFKAGDRYTYRLAAVNEQGLPVCDIVCIPCGTGLEPQP